MQVFTAILYSYIHVWKEPEGLADPHCLQLYFAIKHQIVDSSGGGYKKWLLSYHKKF